MPSIEVRRAQEGIQIREYMKKQETVARALLQLCADHGLMIADARACLERAIKELNLMEDKIPCAFILPAEEDA